MQHDYAAYTRKTITRSVNNNARSSENVRSIINWIIDS